MYRIRKKKIINNYFLHFLILIISFLILFILF